MKKFISFNNNKFEYEAIQKDDYSYQDGADVESYRIKELPPSSTSNYENKRKKYLFAMSGIICICLFVAFKYESHKAEERNVTPSTRHNDLEGTQFLFDFSTEDGALEQVSVYNNTEYAPTIAFMTKNIDLWRMKIGAIDTPDESDVKTTWKTAGGVTPWITDDTKSAPSIKQLYSHKQAPHIVFFLVDDWGYNDAGWQSTYMSWATPNIDKLASEGIKLTQYYSHELCGPSRAALLTGRYATRFGMHGSGMSRGELPIAEVTLAEEMKSAGYRTYLVGKWHLGFSTASKTPTYRGFDYFYGYFNGFVDYYSKQYGNWLDLHENDDLVTTEEEKSSDLHSAYLWQQKAEAVIAEHAASYKDTPMFLYYSSQLIHDMWAAPQHFIDRCTYAAANSDPSEISTTARTYCAMNLMLDEVVANLTCALHRHDMVDNTLLVFVSDNGGSMDFNGTSVPWRGSKGSMFRGGQSVPGFIHGPTSIIPKVKRGTEYGGMMHVTDWLPTLMGLATDNEWSGSMSDAELDGVDMWASLLGESAVEHSEILHYLDSSGNVAYQMGDKKMVLSALAIDPFIDARQVFVGTRQDEAICSLLD